MSVRLHSKSASVAVADEPRQPQSIVRLLRRLTHQLATLLRHELALATAELTQGARTLFAGAMAALAASAVLFAGIILLLSSAVLGLSHIVAPWLAALIVGGAVSVAGIVALRVSLRRLSGQSLWPARATRSLLKDKAAILRRGR